MKKNEKKMLTAVVLCIGAAALVTGCGKKAVQEDTLHLGVMYSSDIVPLAVIMENGLDKANGFQLDMQVFSSAKDRDAALQAGELDGVFTDVIGVCMYQNAGLDVRITGSTDGDYVLLAGPDTGITSLEEAKGKKIAISENTLIEYSLDYILNANGFSDGYLDKQVVPRIPDRLEMLRSGKIELGLLPDPFSTLAVKDGAVVLGSANSVGLYPAVSAFMETSLESKPETIKKMYKAYDEAIDYINNTPLAQYEGVVMKAAGYPEELAGHFELPAYRKNVLPKTEALEEAIRWAVKKGLCKEELKPENLIGTMK